jgi:hypothetical protein
MRWCAERSWPASGDGFARILGWFEGERPTNSEAAGGDRVSLAAEIADIAIDCRCGNTEFLRERNGRTVALPDESEQSFVPLSNGGAPTVQQSDVSKSITNG